MTITVSAPDCLGQASMGLDTRPANVHRWRVHFVGPLRVRLLADLFT